MVSWKTLILVHLYLHFDLQLMEVPVNYVCSWLTFMASSFYLTACIVFTHGVRMGGWLEQVLPGCISNCKV